MVIVTDPHPDSAGDESRTLAWPHTRQSPGPRPRRWRSNESAGTGLFSSDAASAPAAASPRHAILALLSPSPMRGLMAEFNGIVPGDRLLRCMTSTSPASSL